MADKFCSNCKSAAVSDESLFCHKCGARLAENAPDGAAHLSEVPSADHLEDTSAISQGGASQPPRHPAGEEVRSMPVQADSGDFFSDFQAGYYRLSYTSSVLIMIGAVIYIVSPLDVISNAPLISWVDDLLIFCCALINLLHCGIDISKHSENVTFQRIKLITVSLSTAVIFFMWFCVNIVLILFQKR